MGNLFLIYFPQFLLLLCLRQVLAANIQNQSRPYSTRLVSKVAFDGTDFDGWQSQGSSCKRRTVQNLLSVTLRKRFNSSILSVVGSSRTDKGVHARGQTIHFDLPEDVLWLDKDGSYRSLDTNLVTKSGELDLQHLEFSINRMLPDDCKMFNIEVAPNGLDSGGKYFHSIGSASGKLYSYQFCTNKFVDPLRKRNVSHFWNPNFNIHVFGEILTLFIGSNNFKAFSNKADKPGNNFSYIRTINDIKLMKEGDGYYRIDFTLTSALYKMIRNIVGTAKIIAEGGGGNDRKMDKEYVKELLLNNGERYSREHNLASCAPPEGLCLEAVLF
jgi:tRNA pseudouridine38-40 synthase